MTSWSSSSGYMSLAVDLSYSGDPASGSVNVHASVTARSDGYGHNFSSSLAWWGDGGSGSTGVAFSSGFGATVYKRVLDRDFTVSTSYGQPRWVKFGASLGPIWNGGNPSVEGWIQIPARPYSAPSAPTGVTAARQSEAQSLVSWTLPGASAAAPVHQIGVQRRTISDPQWKQMVWITNPAATSWSDLSLPGNDEVEYRVQTWNTSGYSAHAQTAAAVSSTVDSPVNVSAVKDTKGNIVVSWERRFPGAGEFTIFDAGVKVAAVAASRDQATYTWTHVTPDTAKTHTYTIIHTAPDGLASAASMASNTVALLAKPNPPKTLGPTGYADQARPVALAWAHNPTDASPQTQAEVRYRLKGTSPWTTLTATTKETVSATLTAGAYGWQVRTRGLHRDWSDWSAVAAFTVEAAPVVGITTPASNATINTSTLTVTWSYTQAQNVPQMGATVELLDQTGKTIETLTVSGQATTATLRSRVEDAGAYRVRVQARSAHALVSNRAETGFKVSYPAPPAPLVSAVWDEDQGAHLVTLTPVAPLNPTQKVENIIYNGQAQRHGASAALAAQVTAHPTSGSTVTRVVDEDGTTWARATAGTASTDAFAEFRGDYSQAVAGRWVALSATVRIPHKLEGVWAAEVRRLSLVLLPKKSGKPEVGAANATAIHAVENRPGVQRFAMIAPIKDDVYVVRAYIGLKTEQGADMWVDWTDVKVTLHDSEDQARLEAEEGFFDAGMGPNITRNGQSYQVAWAGAVGSSASVATPNSPATATLALERSVDGGTMWEQVADNLPEGTTVIDREALSHGTTVYRATAVSTLPSVASATTEITTESWAMWMSAGPSLALAVPLLWDPKHSVSPGLVNRKVVHFAGRPLGVELAGVHRQRVFSLSATLLDESWELIERLEQMAYLPGPFLYRDPMGRRVYCSLSGVSMAREIGGKWSFAATVEEVDHD